MRWFVLLVALAACESQAESVRAPRPPGIASIALLGHDLPMPALREVMQSQPGDALDSTRLEQDRGALEGALVARGHLAAKVQAAQVSFDDNGSAFVTYSIAPGALYRVRSVAVTGATPRESGVVTLSAGDPALGERLTAAVSTLRERLAARGKPRDVRVQLAMDERAAAVDVDLVVR
jgi:outer membrane protein assembly factor BamA